MALYVIADLHLATEKKIDKPMEIFGQRWQNHKDRLESAWRRLVTDEDTVVVPGDVSWGLSLEDALLDLKFIDSLPGKKILGKGNHDFWWSTMKKHYALFEKEGIKTISFLYNNAHEVEDFVIAGTRGWYHDDDCRNMPDGADFEKLTRREAMRLEASLKEAKAISDATGKEIIAFTHFPPFWSGKESESLVEILLKYGVKRLYFGHIHGNYTVEPSFIHRGILMSIISADYLSFIPKIIRKAD